MTEQRMDIGTRILVGGMKIFIFGIAPIGFIGILGMVGYSFIQEISNSKLPLTPTPLSQGFDFTPTPTQIPPTPTAECYSLLDDRFFDNHGDTTIKINGTPVVVNRSDNIQVCGIQVTSTPTR